MVWLALIISFAAGTSDEFQPRRGKEIPPPEDVKRICAFDRMQCLYEYHVFANVDRIYARCIFGPCKVHYVLSSNPKHSFTYYMLSGSDILLQDVVLFIWYGQGYGSIELTAYGAYVILNRDIDLIDVPKCWQLTPAERY